jgi:hypothetical protein
VLFNEAAARAGSARTAAGKAVWAEVNTLEEFPNPTHDG